MRTISQNTCSNFILMLCLIDSAKIQRFLHVQKKYTQNREKRYISQTQRYSSHSYKKPKRMQIITITAITYSNFIFYALLVFSSANLRINSHIHKKSARKSYKKSQISPKKGGFLLCPLPHIGSHLPRNSTPRRNMKQCRQNKSQCR